MRTLAPLALAVCLSSGLLARAGDDPAAAAYADGLRAQAAGNDAAARTAFERVLAVAPDHAAARRALGWERIGGRWLRGDDALRAKGFVRRDGRWVLAATAPARTTVSPRAPAAPLLDLAKAERLVAAWEQGARPGPRAVFAETAQHSYVADFDVEVAATSFIADPIVGVLQSGVVQDVTVLGSARLCPTQRAALRKALTALSGRDLGDDVAAWRRWLDGAKAARR